MRGRSDTPLPTNSRQAWNASDRASNLYYHLQLGRPTGILRGSRLDRKARCQFASGISLWAERRHVMLLGRRLGAFVHLSGGMRFRSWVLVCRPHLHIAIALPLPLYAIASLIAAWYSFDLELGRCEA